MKGLIFILIILIWIISGIFSSAIAANMAVLAPDQPTIDKKENDKKNKTYEVDLLLGLVDPFLYTGKDMDRPQMFAVYILNNDNGNLVQERIDLLGDVEEILHLNTKSWGANVALHKPGLYQFLMETKPWWDEQSKTFFHQQAKMMTPVFGSDQGWDQPVGQPLEIVPLTRPFGLIAPALFTGLVLEDGKPAPNLTVEMGFINSLKIKTPSAWHHMLKTRTNSLGEFSFLLNLAGWWYCKVDMRGDPLKGPDGKLAPVIKSSLFWLYVDEFAAPKKK